MNDLFKIAKEKDVKGIFAEKQLSDDVIKPFVNDLHIKLKVLDPLGGINGINTYIELMLYNAREIQSVY